jgi:glycosyltransferase involved in cell wall biosynthesis
MNPRPTWLGRYCLDSRVGLAQAARMVGPKTCAVVIPCFNEGETIAALVTAVRQHLSMVIVVDDGSRDTTSAQASGAGARVLSHAGNLGKGAALRTGLRHALDQGFEWVFTMDGDDQHTADDLPAFVECAKQTGALLIVGNRMHNARSIPWVRRQVNWWMSRQLSRRAGKELPDSQCGYRLIHSGTWARLPLKTQHFEVESETLMAFLATGHPVAFVPIRVIGRGRNSHIDPVADALRWWRWWRNLHRSSTQPDQAVRTTPI